jgi:hypothetical protein
MDSDARKAEAISALWTMASMHLLGAFSFELVVHSLSS